MSKFVIRGGNELHGEIACRGAKNAALKLVPATILFDTPVEIGNMPIIEDVERSRELFEALGGEVSKIDERTWKFDNYSMNEYKLDETLVNKFRASIMFVGPLLAKYGKVAFPHPGGCVIGAGSRPIDMFLEGYQKFGATVRYEDEHYIIEAADGLKAAYYFMSKMSVTVTETMVMLAVLAEGKTVLRNCAMEPEIVELADFLNRGGAKITGAGSSEIVIEGVKKLKGVNVNVVPDRIEMGTFAMLAAATKSDITITDACPEYAEVLWLMFEKIGIKYELGLDYIKVFGSKSTIKPYDVKTHEYPGFVTDMQSPYVVLMTQAEGRSLIHETIYNRRLLFTDSLAQMGADIIMCDPHRVVVNGPAELHGKKLVSPDLRAGIALIMAALISEGKTEIGNIYQVDRGYEKIEERLSALGADIERVEE